MQSEPPSATSSALTWVDFGIRYEMPLPLAYLWLPSYSAVLPEGLEKPFPLLFVHECSWFSDVIPPFSSLQVWILFLVLPVQFSQDHPFFPGARKTYYRHPSIHRCQLLQYTFQPIYRWFPYFPWPFSSVMITSSLAMQEFPPLTPKVLNSSSWRIQSKPSITHANPVRKHITALFLWL